MFLLLYAVNLHICIFMTCSIPSCLHNTLMDPWNLCMHVCIWGTAVAQWLRCCATNRNVAGSIPAGVSGIFIGIKSFRSHYGPGVNSASNRNEYQEHSLGLKAAGV